MRIIFFLCSGFDAVICRWLDACESVTFIAIFCTDRTEYIAATPAWPTCSINISRERNDGHLGDAAREGGGEPGFLWYNSPGWVFRAFGSLAIGVAPDRCGPDQQEFLCPLLGVYPEPFR